MADRFLRDVRYALRMLRRNPTFATVAVAVLAIAIGANTATFSLIDALLFKPLPVAAPDELVRVVSSGVDGGLSYAEYFAYRHGTKSLSGLMAFTADTLKLRMQGVDDSERVGAYLVSDNYFDVLGVRPVLGHGTQAAAGEPPGIVLSHGYWERRFAADPRTLGREVWLNGRSFVVAGVAPSGFWGTLRGGAPQVFVPFAGLVAPAELSTPGPGTVIAVGRLARGASVEAAQAELSVFGQRLAAPHSGTGRRPSIRVGPESTAGLRQAPEVGYVLTAIFGTFGLFLALACVNLAALMNARGTFRQKEIAIRAMQGASRKDIAAQLLTESLVLALLGGVVGLLVGLAARNLLWNRVQSSVAAQMGFDVLAIDTWLDTRTTLFALALSVGSILLFALLPALHASKLDLYNRAKADPSSPPPAHIARLRWLVGLQVMVSAVLLACAGLLLQVVRSAASLDMGYPTDRLYIADLDLSGTEEQQVPAVFDDLLGGVRAMPGVEAAALGAGAGPGYLPQSMTPGRARQNYVLAYSGAGYFAATRIPMLAGREFDEHDTRASGPVAIVNQRLAEALWPGQSALGRQLTVWDDQPALTVIGVAKSVRGFPIGPPFFQLYVPLAQHKVTSATLGVRTVRGQEATVRTQLIEELRSRHAGLPGPRVRTLEEWAGSLLAIPRALATVLGALSIAALFLAALGLYGVTAYMAGRRARECAIRRALGATRGSILRLLVGNAVTTILLGLGIGVGLSWIVGWLLKAAVLGSAFDPVALVVAPVTLAVTALAAITWPIFRAASAETMAVLREE